MMPCGSTRRGALQVMSWTVRSCQNASGRRGEEACTVDALWFNVQGRLASDELNSQVLRRCGKLPTRQRTTV